jgi:hypothetical protein
MNFDLSLSIDLLACTPPTWQAMLGGLTDPWIRGVEGPNTFCPFDIVRVMAKQYYGEVGPWVPYLPVLTDHPVPRS